VEARITAGSVEVFHRGKRVVASHVRSASRHRPSTAIEHMPSAHRRYRDWTPDRIRREAVAIGDDTATLVGLILRSRPHPVHGFRSCIGILGPLRSGAGRRRLRAGTGARHALLHIGRRHPEEPAGPDRQHSRGTQPAAENIRVPGYYH